MRDSLHCSGKLVILARFAVTQRDCKQGKNGQRNGTKVGLPVIPLIHGERYMKTFVTLQFLCGWDMAFWLSIEIGGLHAFSHILVRLIANRDTGYPRRLTSFQRLFGEICAMQTERPVARHYCNMGGSTAQCRNCLL